MSRYIDLTGQIFGRLTVVKDAGKDKYGRALFLCECSCVDKNMVIASSNSLRMENKKSCGCLHNEKVILGNSLRNGTTRSCGCIWKDAILKSRWNPNREQIKLNAKLRSRLNGMLRRILHKTNMKKETLSEVANGFRHEDLRKHIASTFTDGMKWERLHEIHIDHIIPISWYLKRGITDPKTINRLDNLQALWKKDNLMKSAQYNPPLRHRWGYIVPFFQQIGTNKRAWMRVGDTNPRAQVRLIREDNGVDYDISSGTGFIKVTNSGTYRIIFRIDPQGENKFLSVPESPYSYILRVV